MSEKKIITVFGATGNQGGAVVVTFLNDPKLKNEWAVRGVTRDVSKESAKKLAHQGVEVVAVRSQYCKTSKHSCPLGSMIGYIFDTDDTH